MTKLAPYKISHIDLSEQSTLLPPDLGEEGSYSVWWWKEIVLGSFFLEHNDVISENEYLDKIVTATLPVIKFNASINSPTCEWNEFSLTTDIALWKSHLETIFASCITENIPEILPVSVIVPTRNRPEFIYQCLNRLMELTSRPQEIIVVDNAPDNNSTRDIVSQFSNVIYILEPRPGLDIARNRGIRESSAPIIAFTDDDVEVHPLWIYRVWETFQNDNIVAMTGLIFAAELETEAECIFEKYWSFNRGYIDKIYDKSYFSASLPKGPPVSEIGAGANMAFRRSVFSQVGYFHELLDVGAAGGSGDSEIWFRILAQGKTIQYSPRAVAYHTHRKNVSELEKQIFSYMRGYTTALLWQHRQRPDAGYKRNILLMLLKYAAMIIKGFGASEDRTRTVWIELKGVISGFAYFYKKENRSRFSVVKKN